MTEAISGVAPVQPAAAERPVPGYVEKPPASADLPQKSIAPEAAEAVEKALRSLDPPIMGQNDRLSISRDKNTGTFIYSSVDRETGKVLRQWPVESMLQFKAYIRELSGVMIDQQV